MTIQSRDATDVGAAHRHIHNGNQSSQRQNELNNLNPNSQDQQQYTQTNNQDQRGRSQRTYNRGRQQRNNQQQQIGQNAAAPTQQSSSQIQSSLQQQPAPVSLSQEREQKAQNQNYNRFMSAGLGSGSGSAQEMSQSATQAQMRRRNNGQNDNQAVQQVIQMNAPASTQSHYSRGNHQQQNYQNRQLTVQSSAIQGAASQTHMNNQSSQMIPASTASHSGSAQSNPFGRNYEGSNNQQTTAAPHGGGGSQRQISNSRESNKGNMGQEGRNMPHHNGVVHTVSFESGSTSFMDRQANSGLAASEQSQNFMGHSNRQQQVPYQRPKNTFTQISQVSSPPSNNINLINGGNMMQARNQSNQQNDMGQFQQNTPNSDMSGPGAVGAPPSSQLGAISSAAQSSMRSQFNNSNMPSSSGINETTSMMQMAAQQPHQQQQNISPGSSQNIGGQNNSAPGQGGHQGQHINRMHRAPLPSVPDNMRHHNRPELEEEKQSSHPSQMSHQQQSIMTIPSSLFGSSNQANNPSLPKHQTPAALQMVGIANDGMDASSGTGTVINYNNSTNLFQSQFDDGQQNSMMNFINSGQVDQQNHEQRATPPRHNNDSRKTSGANTPSKDGANTPTTHQSQSQQFQQIQQNRAQMLNNLGNPSNAGVSAASNNVGASQGQLPSGHSASEFGSAVTAGLNNHLNSLGQGGQQQVHPGSTGNGLGMGQQIGSNNQNNYVHDLTNQQLFGQSQNEPMQTNATASASGGPNADGRNIAGGGPNQNIVNSGGAGMSIIDQLSQSVTQNRNSDADTSQAASLTTASLFDDFLNNIPDGAQKS